MTTATLIREVYFLVKQEVRVALLVKYIFSVTDEVIYYTYRWTLLLKECGD